jgi:hypothetical protein
MPRVAIDAMNAADKQRVASCPRRGVCVPTIELNRTRYTSSLRSAVGLMMEYDPVLSSSMRGNSPATPVSSILQLVEGWRRGWKRGTVDGQMAPDPDKETVRAWRQLRLAEWEKEEYVQKRAEEAEEERAQAALDRARELQRATAEAAARVDHRARWRARMESQVR